MLDENQLRVIQSKLMEATKNEALDGDEVEQLKWYLNEVNANDNYYCAFSLHKDDLRQYFEEDEELLKAIEDLTHEQMQKLAKNFQDVLCADGYWENQLADVLKELIK